MELTFNRAVSLTFMATYWPIILLLSIVPSLVWERVAEDDRSDDDAEIIEKRSMIFDLLLDLPIPFTFHRW